MKKILVLLASISFILINSQIIFSQDYERKSLNVTVYNSDLGVIKDVRKLDLQKGLQEIKITDVAKQIDPTSVHIKLDGEVLEQNYQYDLVSLIKILEKYIDKKIQLIDDKTTLEGTLLSISGNKIVLRKSDGGLLMLPKIDDYQVSVGTLPEGLITKPTLVWTVNSRASGKTDVELSYQTAGMAWHAEYVAVLNEDDTKMDFNSWVSVENHSGATYKDAVLKLIAGDVNRVTGPVHERVYTKAQPIAPETEPQFEEKAFFEYHIYNLQRPTTLADNETKQISLFESQKVNVSKKYLYKSGGFGISGKVAVVVEFENSENNRLGMPLPKGKVRLYKSDGETLEFVGEDMIDHTPKDEKVKLKVGDAFDLVVEDIEREHDRITDKVYESEFEVRIKNVKKEDVTVDIERSIGRVWEILESSIPYEKKDATTIIFKLPVRSNDKGILKFKVRVTMP